MADRVERLTNLLALLLETREPLTLDVIASELGGQYPDGHDARRAAFERDKTVLRDIGVEISTETLTGDRAGQMGYWVIRREMEIPDLGLDDEELRALQLALAATRPGSESGRDAHWKLGAGVDDGPVFVAMSVPTSDALPVLRGALTERRAVGFSYGGVDRVVEPWGLLLRDGFWYLVGHDRSRGDRRTFRVDRISEGRIEVLEESIEVPEGFDVRTALPEDPMMLGADQHSVRSARIVIDRFRASTAVRELGPDRVLAHHDDDSVEVSVPFASLDALVSWVLGFLEHAVVLEPDDVRDEVIRRLRVVAS